MAFAIPQQSFEQKYPEAYGITSRLFNHFARDPTIAQYFRLNLLTDLGKDIPPYSLSNYRETIVPKLTERTVTAITAKRGELAPQRAKYIEWVLNQNEHPQFEEQLQKLLEN